VCDLWTGQRVPALHGVLRAAAAVPPGGHHPAGRGAAEAEPGPQTTPLRQAEADVGGAGGPGGGEQVVDEGEGQMISVASLQGFTIFIIMDGLL